MIWEQIAWAQEVPKEPAGLIEGFWPIAIIFGIFYFLLIRPQSVQQKKHAQRVKELTKGDKVITSGGVYGTIIKTEDSALLLSISAIEGSSGRKGDDAVVIRVSRSNITSVMEDDKSKSEKK